MKYFDTGKGQEQELVPILIYFGPYENESYIKKSGKNLIKLLSKYFDFNEILCNKYGNFIRYKPDDYTRKGIYAGDKNKASLYSLSY